MSDQRQATSNGRNNGAGQNSGQQRVWETVIDHLDSCKRIFGGLWHRVREDFEFPWPEESSITFGLWIFAIIIDPLVFYVPRINDGKKLLDFDRSFLVIISLLYVFICICKFQIYIHKFKIAKAGSNSKNFWAFVLLAPFVPIIASVLLQLSLFFKATKNIRASIFSGGMAMFIILYLVRVLGIYRLFIATALRKSAILRVVINLLLFLYGGHLFGGLWYFFAVWKKMQCWNIACIGHGGCYYANRRFIVTSRNKDNRFLDDICSIKPKDRTYNELGIFKDALESRIVEESGLWKRLLYCLRWGTQNLKNFIDRGGHGPMGTPLPSPLDMCLKRGTIYDYKRLYPLGTIGFAQNLEVSTHAWENIFVIVIAVYGMATFTFFIGNMQNLIKSSTSKSNQETRWTQQDLEKWSPFGKLSKEDQNLIVKRCQQFSWPQTGAVNVKNLLSNLPKDVENNIKRIICLTLLKKVKEFENWSDDLLDELCKCAKPVSYEKHTQIVQNGRSIDEVLFVLEGKLRIYSTSDNADSPRTPGNTLISDLEDDGFCGEELADLFQADPYSSKLPISTRTIRVVEQVDGFAFMSYDLQNVFIKHQVAGSSLHI